MKRIVLSIILLVAMLSFGAPGLVGERNVAGRADHDGTLRLEP
jgi:hypothetical protein